MPVFTLARLVMLLIAAVIHIYRGATGQLQATGRTQRSQLFYVGLGIALFAALLTLFHVQIATLALLAGIAVAVVGLMKPANTKLGVVDAPVAPKGVDL